MDVKENIQRTEWANVPAISCRRESVRPSVSVRPSNAGIVSKWLNLGSHKQCHRIARGLQYSDAKGLDEIRTG